MSSISWDESAVLEQARATAVANMAYTDVAQARALLAALQTLMLFPEQGTLPNGEMFRFNHTEIGKLIPDIRRYIANRSGASGQVTAVRLCGRDGR